MRLACAAGRAAPPRSANGTNCSNAARHWNSHAQLGQPRMDAAGGRRLPRPVSLAASKGVARPAVRQSRHRRARGPPLGIGAKTPTDRLQEEAHDPASPACAVRPGPHRRRALACGRPTPRASTAPRPGTPPEKAICANARRCRSRTKQWPALYRKRQLADARYGPMGHLTCGATSATGSAVRNQPLQGRQDRMPGAGLSSAASPTWWSRCCAGPAATWRGAAPRTGVSSTSRPRKDGTLDIEIYICPDARGNMLLQSKWPCSTRNSGWWCRSAGVAAAPSSSAPTASW